MRRNGEGWTFEAARGGWVLATNPESDTTGFLVLLRFSPVETGRLRISEAVIKGGRGFLDVATWRSIPVAEASTWANVPENRAALEDHLYDGDAEVAIGAGAEDVQPVLRVVRKRSYRLPEPRGRRYPDTFYQRVAEAFVAAVAAGDPPGRSLATANRVPETTVARWIREARRRELLAPAQGKGRIG